LQSQETLQDLIKKQKELLAKIDSTAKQYDESSVVKQNESLNLELEKCKKELEELIEKYKHEKEENENLRIALKEQIFNEKLNILKISREKTETYFNNTLEKGINSLSALEKELKEKTERLNHMMSSELEEDNVKLSTELTQIKKRFNEQLKAKKEKYIGSKNDFTVIVEESYKKLEARPIDEETLKRRIRQNNIEVKIGLSWLNKIGLLLILLGVATAVKYTYSYWFNNYMKGLFIFLLGAAFVGTGEWMCRKVKTVFSIGLNAGGTAILYYGIFSSYFFLKIIDMKVALLLSVIITIITTLFSLRYKSQTINAFALIGGYLPFFSYVFYFGLDSNKIIAAMIYLFLLNLSLLIAALFNKWSFTEYLSFLLNIPVLIYLINRCDSNTINIIYSLCTFTLYLAITLAYPLFKKVTLKIPDIILLALNTTINCIITYTLFDEANLQDFQGLLALIFCVVYFLLGRFARIRLKEEKITTLIFDITALTFAVLIVPFQFGVVWLSIGWTIESVLLICFGLKKKQPLLEYGGWIVYLLCFIAFCIYDTPFITENFGKVVQYFHFKYFTFILGMIIITFFYLYHTKNDLLFKYTEKGNSIIAFKYFTIVNMWIYLSCESKALYNDFINLGSFNNFYKLLLFATVTGLFTLGINQISLIKDKGIQYLSLVLYLMVDILCICINGSVAVFYIDGNKTLKVLSLILLILYNTIVFFNLRYIVLQFIKVLKQNLELYPLLLSIFLLFNITLFLTQQFTFKNIDFIISFIYILFSLIFIIYGFKEKYIYIRRFGLILSIFSSGKLFIYDLSYLSTLWKIVAYFGFGFVLLGISYVYQRLRKAMEITQ